MTVAPTQPWALAGKGSCILSTQEFSLDLSLKSRRLRKGSQEPGDSLHRIHSLHTLTLHCIPSFIKSQARGSSPCLEVLHSVNHHIYTFLIIVSLASKHIDWPINTEILAKWRNSLRLNKPHTGHHGKPSTWIFSLNLHDSPMTLVAYIWGTWSWERARNLLKVTEQGHPKGDLAYSSTVLNHHVEWGGGGQLTKSGRTSVFQSPDKAALGPDQETLTGSCLPLLLDSILNIPLYFILSPRSPSGFPHHDFRSLYFCFHHRCEKLACDVWISAQQHNSWLPKSQNVFCASTLWIVRESSKWERTGKRRSLPRIRKIIIIPSGKQNHVGARDVSVAAENTGAGYKRGMRPGGFTRQQTSVLSLVWYST